MQRCTTYEKSEPYNSFNKTENIDWSFIHRLKFSAEIGETPKKWVSATNNRNAAGGIAEITHVLSNDRDTINFDLDSQRVESLAKGKELEPNSDGNVCATPSSGKRNKNKKNKKNPNPFAVQRNKNGYAPNGRKVA